MILCLLERAFDGASMSAEEAHDSQSITRDSFSSPSLPLQTIEDVANLRLGRWQQNMVPIKEMTDVLKVVKDTGGIKLNSWVRLKRGIFMDDIAQVGTV